MSETPPDFDDQTLESNKPGPGSALRRWARRHSPSTLTLVAVLFFALIGLLLWGVWVFGEVIVTVGRGTSILILGVGFVIALNLIAIGLMLVLLRTIKGRDEDG